MSNTAIANHALLSDRHSAALVDRSGSIEWLSFRGGSPAVFWTAPGQNAGHRRGDHLVRAPTRIRSIRDAGERTRLTTRAFSRRPASASG